MSAFLATDHTGLGEGECTHAPYYRRRKREYQAKKYLPECGDLCGGKTSDRSPTQAKTGLVWGTGLLLALDPAVGASVQHVQRQNAAVQHFIVELLDVELISQFLTAALAQFDELQLAQFVAELLGWPRNIPIRFALNHRFVDR